MKTERPHMPLGTVKAIEKASVRTGRSIVSIKQSMLEFISKMK